MRAGTAQRGANATDMMTRRQALLRLGGVGGSALVYAAATALGLFETPSAHAAPGWSGRYAMQRLPSDAKPVQVAIIGAGIGGLAAACELRRAGYKVTVLEASGRIGGRNLTARAGTVIDELGNPQTCQFDDHPDIYFNCGPARIPGTHSRLLDYCRQFDIALENFVNENPNAYVYSDRFNGGQPVRQREYRADAKGFMAEFAAKAVHDSALDRPIDAGDEERLIGFLSAFGDLGKDLKYTGTSRAGFGDGGLLKPGELKPTVTNLSDLLDAQYWQFPMYFTEGETQFPAMLTPVGGMDKVVGGFVAEVAEDIQTHAIVSGLRVTDNGVAIDYSQNGVPKQLVADFCLNSMPGHLMNGVHHNLPADFEAILSEMRPSKLSKVGLQMKRRFWEDDQIYGGISWVDHPMTQIWYPSHGSHSAKGVLLGGYTWFPWLNDKIAVMRHDDRIESALAVGEKVHGSAYRNNFETGVSIAWQNYNFMLGCGATFGLPPDVESSGPYVDKKYTLQRPVAGRYFMIGDQVSFHPGWQEGALAVTHQALDILQAHVAQGAV